MKDYYYNRFRIQFNEWVRKSDAHPHGNEGIYISHWDINPENLSHIPDDDQLLFRCALACTVLIDQVMYTHFNECYSKFQKMTLYPKIELGINSINVNPWTIIELDLRVDTNRKGIHLPTVNNFFAFFVKELEDFFSTNKFAGATWADVKLAMLNDGDVVHGFLGEIFKKILCK